MSDIKKTMEAYLSMVSEAKAKKESKLKESHFKVGDEVVCKASGMEGKVVAVDPEEKGKYYTVELENGKKMKYAPDELELEDDEDEDEDEMEIDEAKKLDPVNDAENDKKFKDRKDKDIDNDGDVDSSDEYLHKRRAATDDAIDGGKKPAKKEVKEEKDEEEEDPKKKKPFPPKKDDEENEVESEEEKPKVFGKKEKDKNPKTSDKTAEISKIESVTTKEAFEVLWAAIQEAIDQKKGATEPEKMDSKASPKEKEFTKAHEVEVKGVKGKKLSDADDPEKPSKTVKTEMREFEVIRALLSGKPTGEK
jgi:preprotein translocase subunit YajC